MRTEAEYERIAPRAWSSSDPAVLALIAEVTGLPLATRALFATAWLLLAEPFLWGAWVVTSVGHWAPWIVSLGILEPLGMLCLVAGVFFAVPHVALARCLVWVSRQARVALMAIFLTWVGAIVVGLVVAAWRMHVL